METIYQSRIRKRGYIHFLIGLFVRIPSFLKFSYSRLVARAKGAIVDRSVTIPVAVAKKIQPRCNCRQQCFDWISCRLYLHVISYAYWTSCNYWEQCKFHIKYS